MCDAGIDVHTGGAYATYVPVAYLCHCDDKAVFAASIELADAFAAPWTYLVTSVGDEGGMDPEAHKQGVAFISTELGGGGRLGVDTLDIGLRGVRNVLRHLKVIDGEVEPGRGRYLTDVGGSRLTSPGTRFPGTPMCAGPNGRARRCGRSGPPVGRRVRRPDCFALTGAGGRRCYANDGASVLV